MIEVLKGLAEQGLLPLLVAFTVTAALGPVFIPWLHKLKFGQEIRDEGPAWHKKKTGTPTMGGIMFIVGITAGVLAVFLVSLFAENSSVEISKALVMLLTAIAFGLVGFIDDYIKVVKKRNLGLTAKQKTALYSQKDPYLLRLELTSGGKKITDDFGGKVYVYMTGFVPKTGYKNSNYSGYLLKTDGTTEKVSFYSRDARITVEHFSEYFLSRNVKAASNPTTGDTSNVVVWAGVGLAAVAALAVLLVLSRKKKN